MALSAKNMPTVVVVGSVNMDLVVATAQAPLAGETVLGQDLQTIPGGKGANQAVAAARLGAKVRFVGRVGDDAFGDVLRSGLVENGVDVTWLRTTPNCASGVAVIIVEASGENRIVLSPGANGRLTADDIKQAAAAFDGADVCLLQLEVPDDAIAAAIKLCHQAQVRTVLDPAPARPISERLLDVDMISPNQSEAATLLGLSLNESARVPPADLARRLAALADQRTGTARPREIVLKLGKDGAMGLLPTGQTVGAGAFAVDVVDSTAAGDAFTAAYVVARHQADMSAALVLANAAGALACTRHGAQPSLPTFTEVMALLARGDVDS